MKSIQTMHYPNYRALVIPAPVICFETRKSINTWQLERDIYRAGITEKHHSCKIGFRVCYVAELNS